MALQILRAIGAVAAELGLLLLQDVRAGRPRMRAMGVYVSALGELDMDGLRVLTPMDFGLL